MEIQQINNVSFSAKYSTGKILEITGQKIFEPDGVQGYIQTLKQVHGNVPKCVGSLGYKRYAREVGQKIMNKYPDIAKATNEIIKIAEENPFIRAKELKEKIQPILNRFDKEIDIVI